MWLADLRLPKSRDRTRTSRLLLGIREIADQHHRCRGKLVVGLDRLNEVQPRIRIRVEDAVDNNQVETVLLQGR